MIEKPISILFFGTPAAAVPSLEALLSNSAFKIIGAVTQPDRPSGRGQQLAASPVKQAAIARGLPILQPESLKGIAVGNDDKLDGTADNRDFAAFLNERPQCDLFVVVAFGQIIPRTVIDIPRCGILNVHFSLLPRWRGAAPIQRAIAAGDKKTGVAIMRIEPGLDTGPIYAAEEIPIKDSDNFATLHDTLASLGAELLCRTIPKIVSGSLLPVAQAEEGATHAAKWEKSDMQIRWSDPAQTTANRVRASAPFWGARSKLNGELVKIYSAAVVPLSAPPSAPAGAVVSVNRSEIVVQCGDSNCLAISELQLPGKRKMSAKDFLAGNPITAGTKFETE